MSHRQAKRSRRGANERRYEAIAGSSSHRRKLARAEFHIQNVEALLAPWRRNGYRAFEQPNGKGGFVFVAQQLKPLPDIALQVGDALQCLRHSLDHIVFALAKANTPDMSADEEKEVSFPVGEKAILASDKRLACLSDAAQKAVCALAPDPARQPLQQDLVWLLHKSSNRDKHRELPVLAGGGGMRDFALRGADPSDYFMAYGLKWLELGAEPVALLEYTRGPKHDAQVTYSIDVLFAEGVEVARRNVTATLREFHDHIRDTVFERLEPLL